MELADLTRAEWEALLRALYQQEYRDREHGQSKSGLRRNEVLGWADELKGLHERLQEEYRARALRGEIRDKTPDADRGNA